MAEHAGPFRIGEGGPEDNEEFSDTEDLPSEMGDFASEMVDLASEIGDLMGLADPTSAKDSEPPRSQPRPHLPVCPSPWWLPPAMPQPHQPMCPQPQWCPPQPMHPPCDGGHMWQWPQSPWDHPTYMPIFGDGGHTTPSRPVAEAPPAPPAPAPAPIPPRKDMPPRTPPASGERKDGKPKPRRKKAGRYATLYPVD